MKSWQPICYKGFIVVGLLLLRKFSITATNENKDILSLSFIFLIKFWLRISARICGPSDIHILIFSNDKAGRTETMCWKHSPAIFNALTNCFIRPNLMCKGGNRIFSGLTIGSLTIFDMPTFSLFGSNACLLLDCPHANKVEIICKSSLLTKEEVHHFEVHANCPVVLIVF